MTMTTRNGAPPIPRDPFPGVEACDLTMPNLCNVEAKDKTMSTRGINRFAKRGARLDEAIAQGYIFLKPEEAVIVDKDSGRTMDIPPNMRVNGQIIHGDIVFMKIPAARYQGKLKANWIKDVKNLHPNFALNSGQALLREELSTVPGGPAALADDKISAYSPSAEKKK